MTFKNIVSIHQPNFFPYLGFFDKIIKSDIFILLDDVQFQKTGGNWTNRVLIMMNKEPKWLTAPIQRNFSGTKNINEMTFIDSEEWRYSLINRIKENYKKFPFYLPTINFIEPLIMNKEQNITKFNTFVIKSIIEYLNIRDTKIYNSSSFNLKLKSSKLLCELTKIVDGKTYLCGDGAADYFDELPFKEDKIKVFYQEFTHPTYKQKNSGNFVKGLSIIDAMMNIGKEGVISILKIK